MTIRFDKTIEDLIRSRRSRRTYDRQPIESATLRELTDACEMISEAASPFGDRARFGVLDRKAAERRALRFGTYGTIRNARYFLFGTIRESAQSHASFGYLFEHLILKATDLGLSTCWLGFFRRNSFLRELSPGADKAIPAVSSVGYGSDRQSLYEGMVQSAIKPVRRKPWSEIYFAGDFEHPIQSDRSLEAIGVPEYAVLAKAFEMVRLAPSASNLQPWRIVASGAPLEISFYLERSAPNLGYGKHRLQEVDVGIAMCHFNLIVREARLRGSWILEKEAVVQTPARFEFVAAWRFEARL